MLNPVCVGQIFNVRRMQREGIAILGFNSPEFLFANMAAILADGIAAGIYSTNGPEACKYIVNHANATIVVCEGEKQLEKFLQHRADMPQVLAYVVWCHSESELASSAHLVADVTEARRRRIFSFDQFMQLGATSEQLTTELHRRMNHQSPEDVCTLVYTSGTMSMPKAVMISHDNVIFVATSVLDRFSADENERMVSYLPVCASMHLFLL
jgi:long-chain-fatty-acid--CoA ligase ACSBG